jgi:hypothetical protein
MAAVCLCGFGVACEPTGSDAHGGAKPGTQSEGAQAATREKKRKYSNTPILDGTRCAAFVPFVPDKFEGYRAKAAAEGKDIDLGEGRSLSLIRRGYFKTGTALEIEVVDAAQAKPLRDLFERTRELHRNATAAVIEPFSVQGHKALAQWNDNSRIARVSVLVEGQYLVNLSLRPADGVGTLKALAKKMDLAGLSHLPMTGKGTAQ